MPNMDLLNSMVEYSVCKMSQLNAVWEKNGRGRKLLCEMFSLFNRFQLSSKNKQK